MSSDTPMRSPVLTPTRIVMALGLCVVLLVGAVGVSWLAAPRTVTLYVLQPVGKTVVCHVVVDGRAESHQAVAPVTFRFEANELRYAVICLDGSPPADVTVRMHDRAGPEGEIANAGVTGSYTADWWGSRSQMEAMTPPHVANMRASTIAEAESADHLRTPTVPETGDGRGPTRK